jgi:hypothetical protein
MRFIRRGGCKILEIIKAEINDAIQDGTSFDEFYVRYLTTIQDESMELEMKSLVNKHRVTVINTDKYLKSIYATLRKGGDIAVKIDELDTTLNHHESSKPLMK